MSNTRRRQLVGFFVAAVASTMLVAPAAHAKGPAGAYDRAFLTEMVAHHAMAVDMGKMAEEKATHQKLKQAGATIVATQSAEIKKMQAWLERWYGKRANPKLDKEEMAQMDELDQAQGAEFEVRFMALMTVHHTLAIERARVAVRRARHRAVRKLARSIIKAQDREVEEFRAWLVAWYAN